MLERDEPDRGCESSIKVRGLKSQRDAKTTTKYALGLRARTLNL
jgi:hypothetical protein